MRIRQPRVAELVADRLRERILSGELAAGALLPKQDELIAEFGVAPPSLREGLRILETEGLIRVRRGNVGGAVVSPPRPEAVASMLAMVLESRAAPIDDVAASLGELESLAAAMAARQPDRSQVVGALRSRIEASRAAPDTASYVALARGFHEDLVAGCGNETIRVVVGAVESVWSAHVDALTSRTADVDTFDDPAFRERSIAAHEAIADAIERGDAAAAVRLLDEHMHDPKQHRFTGEGRPVQSSLTRDRRGATAGGAAP